TAWYAGSAFLLILAATGFLYWALVTTLDSEDDQNLEDKVHILRVFISERPHDAATLKQKAQWESTASNHAQSHMRTLDKCERPFVYNPDKKQDLSPGMYLSAAASDAEPGKCLQIRSTSEKTFLMLAAHASTGNATGTDH